MRVLCIDDKPRSYSRDMDVLSLIKEGQDYEVYDERIGKGSDGRIEPIYYLVGINQRPKGLAVNRFVPLSDIDETELVNEKEEVYA